MQPYPMPREVEAELATLGEVELDRMLYKATLQFILDNPRRWLQLAMTILRAFWLFRTHIGSTNHLYELSWIR